MSGIKNFIMSCGKMAAAAGESSMAKVVLVLLVVITVCIIALAAWEGYQAYMETRARQRYYHPDPEGERDYVELVLRRRDVESWQRGRQHDESSDYHREARTSDGAEVSA